MAYPAPFASARPRSRTGRNYGLPVIPTLGTLGDRSRDIPRAERGSGRTSRGRSCVRRSRPRTRSGRRRASRRSRAASRTTPAAHVRQPSVRGGRVPGVRDGADGSHLVGARAGGVREDDGGQARHRRAHGRARSRCFLERCRCTTGIAEWRSPSCISGRFGHQCPFGAGACRQLREQKRPLFPAASLRLRGRDSNPNFLVQSQASCR